MHERQRRKDYVKRSELFFFSRRVYHLIVGSSSAGDILSRFDYEIHLQNQGFPGVRVSVHSSQFLWLKGAIFLGSCYLGEENWVTKIMSVKTDKEGLLRS